MNAHHESIDDQTINDAFLVLNVLIHFQHPGDGLSWTTDMISEHVQHANNVDGALRWLLDNGYVEQRGNEWIKTDYSLRLFQEGAL